MKAIFKSLVWEKGTINFMDSSSYNYLPANAVRTVNGQYIVPNSAKLYLTLTLEDGRTITTDIAEAVKTVNGWGKLSEKRYENLRNRLEYQNFQLDGNDEIIGLEKIVLF